MTISIKSVFFALALSASAGPSLAATTGWLSERQLNAEVRSWGGAVYGTPGKFYPTAIDCKDNGQGPRFRMTYTPLTGAKPFYRWNWAFAKSARIAREVARLKRSDKLHLKYRIVQKSSYVASDGVEWTCAIAYR